jgi:TatD DNase family protein
MIDSHCHIQFRGYENDYKEVIKRCIEKDCKMFAVGTQKDTSKKAVEFAEKYDDVYAIIGLHPIHSSSTEVDEEESAFVSREEEFDYEYYKKLAQHPKTVGIGECGIELFHLPKDLNKDEVLEKQRRGFEQQIKLAQELDLPLSIHVRDAYQETLEILSTSLTTSKKTEIRGVIHCYTGNWETARKFLDLGLYLGFTGVVTFPPKKTDPQPQHDLLEVVKKCSLEKMLIETDAPYLAPQAYRGKRCEPWMVEEVAKKIAEVKYLEVDEVVKKTIENTKKLFTL